MYTRSTKVIENEEVLVVAPTGNDASLACGALNSVGVPCRVSEPGRSMNEEIARGVSVLIIAQEALNTETAQALNVSLTSQPAWSDLPVIVLTGRGTASTSFSAALRDLWPSGNITLLERPLAMATLMSSVRMALRARARQHEMRVLLAERALANQNLEQTVLAVSSELERSHQTLRMTERMASLGNFAAGLVHDLDNLLLPLRFRIESLLTRTDIPSEAREDIEGLAGPAEYLYSLTRGLRHFSHDPETGWEGAQVRWEKWCRESEALFRMLLPAGVTLTFTPPTDLPALNMPHHALTQVVANLISNARDAVVARHGRAGLGRVEVRAELEVSSQCVHLIVRDNGTGMSDEVRARCMEPFYTTKVRERGTGLGLAIVHGITHKAGGTVEIESAPEEGTCFTLKFPVDSPGKAVAAS